MVKLKKLSLKAFRSYVEKSSVEFPDSGLVLLRGRNLDTGGSSGSGKSSFVLALNYAIGCAPVPATELQSFLTDDQMKVDLELETDLGVAQISRGQKLQLKIDGETIKGGAKVVNERIDKLFGVSDQIRSILTYRPQKEHGFFLSLTDAEKKEFLTQILNLDKFEKAIDETHEKIRDLEIKLEIEAGDLRVLEEQVGLYHSDTTSAQAKSVVLALSEQLDSCKATVSELQEQLKAADKRWNEEAQAASAKFSDQINEATKKWALLAGGGFVTPVDRTKERELRALVYECSQRLSAVVKADEARQDAQRRESDDLSAKCKAAAAKLALVPVWNKELAVIRDQLRELAGSVCPTCKQSWHHVAGEKDRLTNRQAELMQLLGAAAQEEQVVGGMEARLALLRRFTADPMVAEMESIEADLRAQLTAEETKNNIEEGTRKAEARRELAEAETKMKSLKHEALQAAGDVLSKAPDYVTKVRTSLQSETELQLELTERLSEAKIELHRIESIEQQKNALLLRIVESNARKSNLETKLKAERDFALLIGREGYLSSVFDEILFQIQEETNEILGSVANTRHCTIEFRTENITEKGTVQRKIVPVVYISGHEASLKHGPSGGMGSVIELAVDLAVGNVVSERTGVVPGWLILDEPFEGLGPVEKESALEILQRYAQRRLVLVIDHGSEFGAAFSQFIDVESSGDHSRIVI